ncbi:MAG: sialate O-acetylesterase [Planctomycetota bacterium]|jgi:sialate O-acetylesterase
MRSSVLLALCLAPLVSTTSLHADVRLPALVGNHMVLQCELDSRLWGWAEPGEEISVGLRDQAGASQAFGPTTTGGDGRWSLDLPAQAAGGPFAVTVSGANEIILEDVWFGEVWICSGQSNMEWPLLRADCSVAALALSNREDIRLFNVPRVTADAPVDDMEASWVLSSPATARGFSAVGYLFGRELADSTGHVIGLIQSAWGGTPAEAWTPREKLAGDALLAPILDREVGRKPHVPAALFNGMIAPLLPVRARGVVWYQGESNAGRAFEYRRLFSAMIQSWREAFGAPELAFGFVQLANFKQGQPDPAESAWAELREAQTMALALPNTGMAVIIDVGDATDIHPTNKLTVGQRLGLWARATVYGEELVYSGPLYRSMNVFEGKIELNFDHMGGGLVSLNRGSLHGFQIAGEDRQWKWAKARIFKDQVVVWRSDTPEPIAVRYAWGDDPACNFGNAEGLPASPFRTDDWPGTTEAK